MENKVETTIILNIGIKYGYFGVILGLFRV